ncbi:hypothetical protein N5079_25555 [Planotetraspora sp. A-T 1434]|uniref:ATP-grasp domain-containing protein n=1 Tax=Planotetraspora sp. A-T 1434 TaxID=2979219 RepID=UPI0021BF59E7|nr:hypothetical protein [Planotetraspora sp. A-T 1434]MCT9933585.1 hypothetical protein [Planotetraspora sp. A-T 1434]
MSVLILHRGSLAGSEYDQWLAEYDGDLLLLASREQLDQFGEELPREGYRHAEAIADYDLGGEVEVRALELAREHGVSHIIATQERDLERAAQLRGILGLPGQDLPSVTPFRSKILTKELVQAAGVEVSPYAEVECATDIIAFVHEHGLPVVVKPRDGGGSIDVTIIRTQPDLDVFLDHLDLGGPSLPNLMVESYVPGLMCHVDGLVVGGRVVFSWPSQYQYALAVFRGDHSARLDLTLDADDPLSRRLIDLVDRILGALPSPETFTFHAEIFHTPDDRLVLCEIACRTAGAAIRDTVRTMFSADPSECWVRAQLGLPMPLPESDTRLEPTQMAGQLLLLKRAGKVISVPEGQPPFDWVEHYRLLVRPGQVTPGAAFAGDFMATFVGSAPTRAECERRLRELAAWFNDGIVIEPSEL